MVQIILLCGNMKGILEDKTVQYTMQQSDPLQGAIVPSGVKADLMVSEG